MNNIARNTRKYVIKFAEYGGLAGLISYLIEGELIKALLIFVIFGFIVGGAEYYFRKLP